MKCDGCGACCDGTLIVEADGDDVAREPRIMQKRLVADGERKNEYCSPFAVLIACHGGYTCGFLGPNKRCSIYRTRPAVCRGFRRGSGQCQAVRKAKGVKP